VIAIDTNVLARWVFRDDEAQYEVSARLLEQPCWAGWTVLLELGWLLGTVGKLDRRCIADVLESVLSIRSLTVDRPARFRWALGRFRERGDFAGLIHVADAQGVSAFVSFEKRLANHAGPDSPTRIERAH
jgi:predicted nucleic-acid-binding protein